MKTIIDYLRQLAKNNDREWFNAHKDEYLQCKARFEEFAAELIGGIRQFDDSIGALTVRECTYRIYRDTRFSADKTPYKTHMGAFIVPGGKKSGNSGYYFQVGAYDNGFPGGCMLATGNYCCEPRVLKLLREDIVLDEGTEMRAAIDEAKGFALDFDGALKRVPAGMPQNEAYSDWLRLKNYCLVKDTGVDYMLADRLLERTLKDFESTHRFLRMVNRAIDYCREEEL